MRGTHLEPTGRPPDTCWWLISPKMKQARPTIYTQACYGARRGGYETRPTDTGSLGYHSGRENCCQDARGVVKPSSSLRLCRHDWRRTTPKHTHTHTKNNNNTARPRPNRGTDRYMGSAQHRGNTICYASSPLMLWQWARRYTKRLPGSVKLPQTHMMLVEIQIRSAAGSGSSKRKPWTISCFAANNCGSQIIHLGEHEMETPNPPSLPRCQEPGHE